MSKSLTLHAEDGIIASVEYDFESILKRHRFTYKKGLGQNFIFDADLLDFIARSGDAKDKVVVEVGAGAGTLTQALARYAKHVYAFEIDEAAIAILKETTANFNNCTICTDDVLKVGTSALDKQIGEPYVVVANLPYYITTPLLFAFLQSPLATTITVMVQKEVAERVCATSGSDFSVLSASVQSLCTARIVKVVTRDCFTPPPDVDSALLRLDRLTGRVYDERLHAYFKSVFLAKRKTVANNVSSFYKLPKSAVESTLLSLGMRADARAESLGVDGLVQLGNALNLIGR